MKKINQKKGLSATVLMLMPLAICHVATTQASDIDIYSNATGGKLTLFMMFDTSGSMGHGEGYWGQYHGDSTVDARNSPSSLVEDYNVCKWSYTTSGWISLTYSYSDNTKTDKKLDYKVGTGATKSFYPTYCSVSQSTFNNLNNIYKNRIQKECDDTNGGFPYICYDRISRLKIAMIKLLSGQQILDSTRIGLGQFSSPINTNEYSHDGKSSRILYPVVELTQNNREKLLDKIVSLNVYNGTPSAVAYAEAAAYLLGINTYAMPNSGYSYSDASTTPKIRNANNGYVSPLAGIDTSSQCNGQGIYFLTDGFANNSYTTTKTLMEKVLDESLSGTGLTGNSPSGNSQTQGWPEIGKFSKTLRNDKYIKTAVVGFGSLFPNDANYVRTLTNTKNKQSTYYDCSKLPDPNVFGLDNQEKANRQDLMNTCNWGAKPQSDIIVDQRSQIPSNVGGYGNGGFYSAQSPDDVVQSVVKFLDDVKPEFDPVATGSPTLPQDALNPLRIQPYGYYASFTPKPQESTQLWGGNMNKYHIHRGELYNSAKTIPLIKSDGSLDSAANGLWTDGMKGQLPLGLTTNTANEKVAQRTLYTNRQVAAASPYTASQANGLKKVNVTTLFGTDSNTALFVNDPDKNYWLNLLGYNVGAAESGITLTNLTAKPELRQVGAVMHSTPLLLTQSGKITVGSGGVLDTKVRDDYLLFGSTQGLLHVVHAGKNETDPNRGKEVFAFAPNEMMQNQKAAFLSETSSTGGKNNLFYGIDAPWTAFTQYVAKSDGTLTVTDSGRTVKETDDGEAISLKGLQWVYGGLRMGGKSYYALDLSDLGNPSLKFHIDPENQKIYNSATTKSDVTALSYMGKSWSKPTIAYINFGGVKKLVMFVGGGYDMEYEKAAYNQTNGVGAGVYMFDANNGDLLWWTSANATAEMGAEAYTNASDATTLNMKYSVVSQINAIDRDSDGLVDNLYFGDLGGQAFRVDLNNNVTAKSSFATRVVRLFTQNASGGASPRFYEIPSMSIHDGDSGYIAAVAFSSGNRSSPLVGTEVTGGNQAGSTVSPADGVFVVYDKDVARTDLYTLVDSGTTALKTKNVSLVSLDTTIGVPTTGTGWKYTYSSTAGAYKGMNELYAVDGMLYVNVYHRDGAGIGGACGAGVKGDSYVYQFCLPTGKCSFNTTTTGQPNRVKLGAGILGAGLGQGFSNANNTGLVVKRPTTLNCTTTPNLPECQEFTTTAKLKQLRWYETR